MAGDPVEEIRVAWDEKYGRNYYYNKRTKKTGWSRKEVTDVDEGSQPGDADAGNAKEAPSEPTSSSGGLFNRSNRSYSNDTPVPDVDTGSNAGSERQGPFQFDISRVNPADHRKDMLRRQSTMLSRHIVTEMEQQTQVTASERLMKPIGKVRRQTRVQMQKEQDVYTFKPEMSPASVDLAFEHRQRTGLENEDGFDEAEDEVSAMQYVDGKWIMMKEGESPSAASRRQSTRQSMRTNKTVKPTVISEYGFCQSLTCTALVSGPFLTCRFTTTEVSGGCKKRH
jgi:hypothetical protein